MTGHLVCTQNAHTKLGWETLIKVYTDCSCGFGYPAHIFSINSTIGCNNGAFLIPTYVDSMVIKVALYVSVPVFDPGPSHFWIKS